MNELINYNLWVNTKVLGKKPFPVPVCPAQTSNALPWD
jgi:hypothetical protein